MIRLEKATRPIKELIWHCTATPAGRNVTVDQIRQWHKERGWQDIGYHYVVMLDGTVFSGRPINTVGAHVAGHNSGTIGAVYVGGVDADFLGAADTRTPAQKKAMLELTKALNRLYSFKRISGHNEYAPKACPSFKVTDDPLGNIPGFVKGRKV
jgi:N-acetylmuramoyl-L-alanine amidase